MRRWTNLALLGLLVVAFATGWLGFWYATVASRWSLAVHAATGVAILLLTPWKSLIARRGVGRRGAGSWPSILLAALLLVCLGAGFLHSTGILIAVRELTAMEFHVGAAMVAVPLLAWHLATRRTRPRATDISRRNLLRTGALIATAGVTYGAIDVAAKVVRLPGGNRRFTGSYEMASFRPDLMPVTQWMFDQVQELDAAAWQLTIRTPAGRRALTYAELSRFDDRAVATLDCTGGFYSTQQWAGVVLSRLIGPNLGGSPRSLCVRSQTGYARRFPIEEAARILVATRIGGQALSPGQGFPVRIVAPDRRGFWWVKWVTEIAVEETPYWWQLPFPAQ